MAETSLEEKASFIYEHMGYRRLLSARENCILYQARNGGELNEESLSKIEDLYKQAQLYEAAKNNKAKTNS